MRDLSVQHQEPLLGMSGVCLSEEGEKGSSGLLCFSFSMQGKTNFSRVSFFLCKEGKCNHLSSKFTDVDKAFHSFAECLNSF